MNFGNRFPDGNGNDIEQIITYLVELRETLTAWETDINNRLKAIETIVSYILASVGGVS